MHGRECTFLDAAQPRKRPHPPASTCIDYSQLNSRVFSDASGPDHVLSVDNSTLASNASQYQDEFGMLAASQDRQSRSPINTAPAQEFTFDGFAEQFLHQLEDRIVHSQCDDTFLTVDCASNEPLTNGSKSTLEEDTSLEHQLDTIGDLNPQTLGSSGDMDPMLLQHYRYNASGVYNFKQLGIRSTCKDNPPTQFLLSQPALFSSLGREMGISTIVPEAERAELERVVPIEMGRRLIGLLRRYVLPQYPVFSESLFPDPDSSPSYLLAAIYMIAQPFARFDDVLSVELAYDDLDSRILFKPILRALQHESLNPSISLVQTMLLLVIRPSANPLILDSSLRWSFHGALVTAAQTIGLHLDPALWNIPLWQIGLRRRLSCTIFSTDKWLACSLGRPPLISQDNWLVTSLTNTDGHGCCLSPENWSKHVLYSALSTLLEDTLRRLFSARAMSELGSDFEATLSISKTLLDRLYAWHEDSNCTLSKDMDDVGGLSKISLLGYHYLWLTISRAVARVGSLGSGSGDTTSQRRSTQDELRHAHGIVRSATVGFIDFLRGLQQEQFHVFWPQWSQVAFSCVCFLALVMAVSSQDAQEAATWFHHVHAARKEMRLRSNVLPVIRLGLLRIDALFWKGLDKVLYMQPHVREALESSRFST